MKRILVLLCFLCFTALVLTACDGSDGKDGMPGIPGIDGSDGSNGVNGDNGTNGEDGKSPITQVDNATETECTYGGLKFITGFDNDSDGIIEAITTTSFACNKNETAMTTSGCVICHTSEKDSVAASQHIDGVYKTTNASCISCHADSDRVLIKNDAQVGLSCMSCHEYNGKVQNNPIHVSYVSANSCVKCHDARHGKTSSHSLMSAGVKTMFTNSEASYAQSQERTNIKSKYSMHAYNKWMDNATGYYAGQYDLLVDKDAPANSQNYTNNLVCAACHTHDGFLLFKPWEQMATTNQTVAKFNDLLSKGYGFYATLSDNRSFLGKKGLIYDEAKFKPENIKIVKAGRVNCETCHDPHTKGFRATAVNYSSSVPTLSTVSDADKAAAAGVQVFSAEFKLCTSCHATSLSVSGFNSSTKRFSYVLNPNVFNPSGTFNPQTTMPIHNTGWRNYYDSRFVAVKSLTDTNGNGFLDALDNDGAKGVYGNVVTDPTKAVDVLTGIANGRVSGLVMPLNRTMAPEYKRKLVAEYSETHYAGKFARLIELYDGPKNLWRVYTGAINDAEIQGLIDVVGYNINAASESACSDCHDVHAGTKFKGPISKKADGSYNTDSEDNRLDANVIKISEEWGKSGHGDYVSNKFAGSYTNSCLPCHDGRKAIVINASSSLSRSNMEPSNVGGKKGSVVGCVTCHDMVNGKDKLGTQLMSGAETNDGTVYALRSDKDATGVNFKINPQWADNNSYGKVAGLATIFNADNMTKFDKGQVCVSCHIGMVPNSYVSWLANDASNSNTKVDSSHYFTAAAELLGLNFYQYSDKTYAPNMTPSKAAHTTNCVTCHAVNNETHTFAAYTYSAPGKTPENITGLTVTNAATNCVCHSDATEFIKPAKGLKGAVVALDALLVAKDVKVNTSYPYSITSVADTNIVITDMETLRTKLGVSDIETAIGIVFNYKNLAAISKSNVGSSHGGKLMKQVIWDTMTKLGGTNFSSNADAAAWLNARP